MKLCSISQHNFSAAFQYYSLFHYLSFTFTYFECLYVMFFFLSYVRPGSGVGYLGEEDLSDEVRVCVCVCLLTHYKRFL
jgi:hypothetical protein